MPLLSHEQVKFCPHIQNTCPVIPSFRRLPALTWASRNEMDSYTGFPSRQVARWDAP